MLRFFGRKKEDAKPQVDLPQAIVKNREAIATLEKRQAHLERRIACQEEDARRRAKEGDKRGALFALKRKKMFEKELEQLGNAHLTLEQQIMTLESAQAQQVAVGALVAGVTAQKALNRQLNMSKIDDVIEDMQEQVNIQNELAQVLSQGAPYGDDAELLAELQEIEAKQLEETLVDASPVPTAAPGTATATMGIPTATSAYAFSTMLQDGGGLASPLRPSGIPTSNAPSTSRPQQALSDEEQLKKLLNDLA